MIRALVVGLTVLLLGGAIAGVWAVLSLREATAPPSPQAWVDAAWSVYRYGPGHRNHVGKLHLECGACHQPSDEGFGRPGPAPCRSCHEDRANIEHAKISLDADDHVVEHGGVRKVTDCLSCHGFGPDPMQEPTDCLVCHDKRQGENHAIALHTDAPCAECHQVHENEIKPVDCAQCHPLAVEHAPHPDSGAAMQCLDCHDMHGPAELAEERCLECHGEGETAQVAPTAAFGEHACTGCHRPHSFAKKDAAPCRSCHTDVQTMQGATHTECRSCHEPHGVRESVRERNVCATCHRDVAVSHKQSEDAVRVCTNCHDPHPQGKVEGPAACTTCHEKIGGESQHAHAPELACTSCHTPHEFTGPETSEAFCGRCHRERQQVLAHHPGHKECTGCHQNLPHGPDTSPVACARCHEQEGRDVNSGHAVCLTCHDGHTGVPKGRACESCHERESALREKAHKPCTSCHEQHSGEPKTGVADCSACHDRDKLPGLHAVAEHAAACTSCHEPHGSTGPATRERCLSCHQDRVDHEPEADRCSGCHAFIGAHPRRAP